MGEFNNLFSNFFVIVSLLFGALFICLDMIKMFFINKLFNCVNDIDDCIFYVKLGLMLFLIAIIVDVVNNKIFINYIISYILQFAERKEQI